MAINRIESGAIIIAGSGMCNGGRIVHHLKRNLGRKECHVVIPGYQARGTIGRRLVDGDPSIRIHGDYYPVRAQIHTVGGLSAHGDRDDLVRWLSGFSSRPEVYLVHGEPETLELLRGHLGKTRGLAARVATPGMRVDLAAEPQTGVSSS
jgi:metallo-beta-lactamase family protein